MKTERKLLRLGRWTGRVLLGTAVVAFALASVAGVAKANSIQYNLTQDGCSVPNTCNPGSPGTSMGTVVLTDVAPNDVQVTINLVDPLEFMSSGIGTTIAFNLSGLLPGAVITAANLDSNFSFPPSPYPALSSIHMSTFGYFDYGIDLNTHTGGVGAYDASPLTFDIICQCQLPTLTPSRPFSVDSFAQQSTGGSFPAYFAVDVYNSNTGNTGAIGAVDPGRTVVPEAGTLSLLGTGLLGLFGLALYRRRSTSV